MSKVKLINAGWVEEGWTKLHNGDIIILYKGNKEINHMIVSSYKGNTPNRDSQRLYCTLIQLRNGTAYKKSPLLRNLSMRSLSEYLISAAEYGPKFFCNNKYDFMVVRSSECEISVKVIREVISC